MVDLDREDRDAYEFNVVARDGGQQIRLADVTNVRVTITDHNDSPPVFGSNKYKGQVPEDAMLGKCLDSIVTRLN